MALEQITEWRFRGNAVKFQPTKKGTDLVCPLFVRAENSVLRVVHCSSSDVCDLAFLASRSVPIPTAITARRVALLVRPALALALTALSLPGPVRPLRALAVCVTRLL